MSSGLAIVLVVALLMAAAGVVLWSTTARRENRLSARRHMEARLAPAPEPAAVALGDLRFGAPPPADTPAPEPNPWRIPLPGWLLGAVRAEALVAGVVLTVLAFVLTLALAGWLSALVLLTMLVLGGIFLVWLRVQKMRQQMVRQLPAFLDVIVRLIVVGNSTQAAFQMAVQSAKPPLRSHMDNAMAMVKAGMDVDQALLQVARKVRIEEMFLLASILGLGVRYGGRSDVLLERVAHFMRDREESEQELSAMSAETRLSAWILSLLPVGVGGLIMMNNPDYFMRMWGDPTGQSMVIAAAALQVLGVVVMYRLARLD